MKQIVVISGKGGTGKTVITGAFAALAKNKVMADCDVDAADLHLLLAPEIKEKHEFKSGVTASIDKEKCTQCGKCIELCRFEAIDEEFIVDSVACEGCAFCGFACPAGAIQMRENTSGEWFISETRFGQLVHAKLGIAEENSGKLVSLVRQKAKEIAENENHDWIIIDGSPGIGCPVIASISGVDCALIITEPTLSGLHDADRVIRVARHFSVPVRLIINKYDLNLDVTEKIEKYCRNNNVGFIGKIAFDRTVVEAMVEGKTIAEYSNGETKEKISEIWDRLQKEVE
ncbi:MAG: ATP-binding protein [Candidatus Kaelpia imicola]|nr:ATP-binding protein [Candidatus Kaelpia imicola]